MKKNSPSKRLLSLLLCLALFLSLGVSSFAEARMDSAPAVEERGTFKPAELREDDSPDGAASRTEEPEAAPQPDEPKADYAVFVYIVAWRASIRLPRLRSIAIWSPGGIR